MKVSTIIFVFIAYCAIPIEAKGAGAGKGGKSSSSKSSGSKNTNVRILSSGSRSHYRGTSSFFTNGAPPRSYSDTRNTYTNYSPAYARGYTSTSPYGTWGVYNPSITYVYIVPPYEYCGYTENYRHYNQKIGYYYVPELTYSGSNSSHIMINNTANDGEDINYRTVFDISTDNQFVTMDSAYFSSSDVNAIDADFVTRLQLTHLVEFKDADGKEIGSATSLQGLKWNNFQVNNITVPNNATQSYLQTGITASVIYNNTSPVSQSSTPPITFNVSIIFDASNLQINITSVPLQPNSFQYKILVTGFPTAFSKANPNAELVVTTLLASTLDTPMVFDVNTTTPADVAALSKSNTTYGISIGQYTQVRFEVENNVNISGSNESVVYNWGTIDPQALANTPNANLNQWMWGNYSPPTNRTQIVVYTTLPGYTGAVNETINTGVIMGLSMGVDVMNAIASESVKMTLVKITLIVHVLIAYVFAQWI